MSNQGKSTKQIVVEPTDKQPKKKVVSYFLITLNILSGLNSPIMRYILHN